VRCCKSVKRVIDAMPMTLCVQQHVHQTNVQGAHATSREGSSRKCPTSNNSLDSSNSTPYLRYTHSDLVGEDGRGDTGRPATKLKTASSALCTDCMNVEDEASLEEGEC
jgi:hypothetical protein